MLYLVAVVEHPTNEELSRGVTEKVVVKPKVMVGMSAAKVGREMLMSGDIPKGTDPARTGVQVIPFVPAPV